MAPVFGLYGHVQPQEYTYYGDAFEQNGPIAGIAKSDRSESGEVHRSGEFDCAATGATQTKELIRWIWSW